MSEYGIQLTGEQWEQLLSAASETHDVFREVEGAANDVRNAVQSASGVAEISAADFQKLYQASTLSGSGMQDLANRLDLVARGAPVAEVASLTKAIDDTTKTASRGERALSGMWGLWRARAIEAEARKVRQYGEELLDTALGWTMYAAEAGAAEDVMNRMAQVHDVSFEALARYEQKLVQSGRTTTQARADLTRYMQTGLDLTAIVPTISIAIGDMNNVMEASTYLTARFREEYGQQLLPAYERTADIVNAAKRAFVEADDSVQGMIATGTVMAGTFLTVSSRVLEIISHVAILNVLFKSLAPVISSLVPGLTVTAGALLGVTGVIGLIAGATAGLYVESAKLRGSLMEQEAQLIRSAPTYEAYLKGLEGIATQIASYPGEVAEYVDLLAMTREEWEAGISAAPAYAAGIAMTSEAIEAMATISGAMVPAAAAAFGGLARAQEDIQNELETKRREHTKVMADIDKYGYTEQRMAQATALESQMRQLELAGMRAEEESRRSLGQIAIRYIETWGEITGEQSRALEAIGAAGIEFGLWKPAEWEQAERFMEQLELGGEGKVPWAEAIKGAAEVTAEAVNITANTVALDGPVVIEAIYLPESLFPGVGGAPGQEPTYTVQPSLGEEALTEGVRTRR
jgi:hypothetical protein